MHFFFGLKSEVNMLRSIFYLLMLVYLLSGCSGSNPETYVDSIPQIIEQTTFPPIPPGFYGMEFVISAKIYVSEEGKVLKAFLSSPTADTEWDSIVTKQITKWRYIPAKVQGKPVAVWVNQSIRIQLKDQQYMMLSEIVLESLEKADSIYLLLKSGDNFAILAKKYSVSGSAEKGGSIGEVNLKKMPYTFQKELYNLEDGAITKPVCYQSKYYIFKRLPLVQ
jgi:hypothetical protein